MFKCSCRRMKCDEESDAWNNLRISHIHVFLKNLGQHVPRKKNMEFAKVRRKKFFFGEDDVFQMKEFRKQPSYIYYSRYIFLEKISHGPQVHSMGQLVYWPTWMNGGFLYGFMVTLQGTITYPTLGKGNSSSKCHFGGYVSSLEG